LVKPGELFVSVAATDGTRIDPSSVTVRVDGRDATALARVGEESVRLLLRSDLTAGRHELQVSGRTLDGSALAALSWHFQVEGYVSSESRSPPTRSGGRFASFTGRTLITTRNSSIDGDRSLRQEPESRYAVRADAEGRLGEYRFPVLLHLTTDESSLSQPRNRLLLGVEHPMFSAYLGDTNPRTSPVVLNGLRTRGFNGALHSGRFHLNIVHGKVRRGINGLVIPNQDTSPFGLPGSYQRRLSAVSMGFGNPGGVLVTVGGMTARDDTTSAIDAQSPIENLVVHGDVSARTLRGKLHFEGGAAMSVTTFDISRGVATKAEMDSAFNANIPIDPEAVSWLLTINTSTVPLRPDNGSSVAWYTRGRFALPYNTVTAEVRHVGSAYYSAGSPYTQNDRRSITVADRFRLVGGRLIGNVSYQYYGSLSGESFGETGLRSQVASSRVSYQPTPSLPRVTGGLRMQWRRRNVATVGRLTDTRVMTFTLGASHTFDAFGIRHTATGFWNYTRRTDEVNESLGSKTHSLSAGLVERLPGDFALTLQATHLRISYNGPLSRQDWTTIAGTLSRTFEGPGLTLQATVRHTYVGATNFALSSNRLGGLLLASYQVRRDMVIELGAGLRGTVCHSPTPLSVLVALPATTGSSTTEAAAAASEPSETAAHPTAESAETSSSVAMTGTTPDDDRRASVG
jgi:hypothetical protein